MKDKRITFGCSLLAVKVVQEYIKFLEAGMAIEIEALTEYYVKKFSIAPTETCHKKVIMEVGKLLRIRSARYRRRQSK